MLVEADHGATAIADLVEVGRPSATVTGDVTGGRCRRGAHALGDTGRTTGDPVLLVDRPLAQKVSTGLIVLPALMSRTAWSISANG